MTMRADASGSGWLDAASRLGAAAEASDAWLLARYRDGLGRERELAFEALVRRHGPLVLGRCRAILRDDHAADDAFQATFLVLARRAGQVRDPDRLAAWLGRVARRIALGARRDLARTRRREAMGAADPGSDGPGDAGSLDADDLALVGAAVDELAERDRLLVRLTYWQGKTYEEVAALLCWPVGTVRGRLHRARQQLRIRLSALHRTLGVPMFGPPGRLDPAAPKEPAEALVLRTVRGVGGSATTRIGVADSVIRMAQGGTAMGSLGRRMVGGLVLGVLSASGVATLAQRAVPPAGASGTPAPPGGLAPGAPVLANPGFEEGDKAPVGWKQGRNVPGVEYLWAADRAHGGKRSVGFRKTADRYFPIAEWTQWTAREGREPRLRVVAWVRAEAASKAVLDVQFRALDGTETHAWAAYIGAKKAGDDPVTHEWRRVVGVVAIPDGTREVAVAPPIYGPGAVWFDDLSVEYTDAPAVDPTAEAGS